MPLDKLVLLIVIVLTAAGVTIWVGAVVAAATQVSAVVGLAVFVPIALVAYVVWRVISERLMDSDDDHYDGIEK